MNTRRVRLGSVCTIVSGSTPKSEVAEYWDGDIKWITPAELTEDSYIITDSVRHITSRAVHDTSLKPFPEGTVILSSRAPIGKTAIAGCEMYCNQGFKNLICSPQIDPKYLYCFLSGKTDFLNSLGRGATFKEISKAIVENIEIPLPELAVQRRIALQFEHIRALIRQYREQLHFLDQLVKSRFMEQFGCYLGDEPRCATVEQVCTVFADGDWIESKDQADDGIRLIQTGNVGNGVYLDKGERARYIDEETFARLNCTEVLPNDILISRLPDPVGRACIIPDGLGKTITAVDCSIVRLKRHVLPEFFVAYTMTTLYAAQIGSSVTGSTRKRISRKNLGQVVIPTPDIDQQEQFAAFVRQSDKSKLAVQQSIDQLETLKKSLMQKYFG